MVEDRGRERPALWLILAVVGCKDTDTDTDPGPTPRLEPYVEVSPPAVSFGPVEVGVDPVREQVVTLSNACEGDLEIYDMAIQNPDYPFSLGSLGTVLVPAGSSTEFTVSFDPPTSAAWNTKILIDTNDPETPTATVDLYGEGVAPVIAVDPESHDFGAPYMGCRLDQPFTIMNLGNADLVVEDFEFATGTVDFSFDPNGELPFFISPGLGLDVYLNYMGLDEFPDTATLTVYSNDPWHPEVEIEAAGTATLYGKKLDTFEQAMKGAIDVVLTLDRSESMEDDEALVLANLGTLVNGLAALDVDWHLSVVVEDDGCVLGSDSHIDNTFSSSSAESTIETMADLDFLLGSEGDLTEAGFSLAEAGLKSSNIGVGGCNEGMVRSAARLFIAHVSDGPDHSANPYTYYVSLFQSMKADPAYVTVNAASGDSPSGCGTADYGEGYYEASVATGGSFLSICDSAWGADLADAVETAGPIPPENDTFVVPGVVVG